MSTYTDYTLNIIEHDKEMLAKVIDVLHHEVCGGMFYINGEAFDTFTWYDHTDDMLKVSLHFPTTVITLEGKVEDGRHWIK